MIEKEKVYDIELRTYISKDLNQTNLSNDRFLHKNKLNIPEENQVEINYKERNDNRTRKELKRNFRKYSLIMNPDRMIKYTYICVAFEAFTLFYYAYNLIKAFTNVSSIAIAFVWTCDYSMTLINIVMYLIFLIRASQEKIKLRTNKESEFQTSPSLRYLVKIMYFRVITWYLKYILYLAMMIAVDVLETSEYWKIPILFFEYFTYHLLKFYIQVLIKLEKLKVTHKIKDD